MVKIWLGVSRIGRRAAINLTAVACAVLAWLSLVGPARAADPPPLLPIQGFLASASGAPVDGAHGLRFSLYPSETATTPVYVETDANVAVTAGSFVVYLGAAQALPLALFRDSAQLWLEVVVDGTEIIQPRVRIATAPYAGLAQYCGDAATLGGSPGSAFATAAHTHAFSSLTGVPAGLADGDDDLLATLTCAAGQVVQRGAGSAWTCASLAPVAASGSFADLTGVPGGLVTSRGGAVGFLPRFASDSALASSNVFQDEGGNVGIGVSRPGALLHVNGAIRWGGSGNQLGPAGSIDLGDAHIVNAGGGELRIIVNTLRMMEASAGATNVVLGFSGNSIAAGVVGASIAGGGGSDSFGLGGNNLVAGDFGAVGGGIANQAGSSGQPSLAGATVGGGQANTAAGDSSTVCGGANNSASGASSTVAGGLANGASESSATVGGGTDNIASNQFATIAGGSGNRAAGYTAVIGGGSSNQANGGTAAVGGGIFNKANGDSSVIGGGASNTTTGTYAAVAGGANAVAGGDYSAVGGGNANTAGGMAATIAGGWLNTATGKYSFAGGRRAKANQDGCFAWGDSQDFDIPCNTANAWVARATGGVSFITGVNAGSGAATAGVSVAAGSGTWASLSDRNAKRDIRPVDARAVLAALVRVPVSTWSYRAETSGARHMGPMAQDFQAAFGLGDSDKHITTVDADGVALAAVVGLHGISQDHDARLAQLSRENAELRARLERLESRLRPVASGSGATPRFGLGLGVAGVGLVGLGLVAGRRRRDGGS